MNKAFSVGQKIVWMTNDRVDGYQEHPGNHKRSPR